MYTWHSTFLLFTIMLYYKGCLSFYVVVLPRSKHGDCLVAYLIFVVLGIILACLYFSYVLLCGSTSRSGLL
jgi:hypothetical protein